MRKLFWVVTGILIWSCQDDSSEIGTDFFKDGSLDIAFIDTVTVRLSTVKFDSLITSNTEKIMLGSYVDPRLGRITASSFLQPGVANAIDLDNVNRSLDYVALVLKYNRYFYYDTTSLITLNAYRVVETMEANDNGYLYNTSRFACEDDPWGSVSFFPRPNRSDSVEIKLPLSFAQELFSKAQNAGTELQSNEDFLKYVKGVAVIPDTASSGIIGFSLPELRLYYIDKSVVPSERRYVSFPVNNTSITNLYSTAITVNRSATKLNALPSYKERLASANTDDEAYLQAGAGLGLRVDIPYLRSLKQNTNFFVTQALLEIYPVKTSHKKLIPLPDQLPVYAVDRRNTIYGQLSTNALLLEDIDLNRDTRYYLDVTSFVKEQMELEELNENALLFLLDDAGFRGTVDRVYFAAPGYGYDYKTRLKLFYATINY